MNLVSMTATIFATGLGPLLFGERGLTIAVVFQVFGLLVLLAAFFSAVLLAVTSFARSFKEAQAYLIPLMIVSIAPGIFSMMPGVQLDGLHVAMPLANIVLLARDLFSGPVDPLAAGIVVTSTLIYALAALMVAARIFGTDAILYGSPGTWSDALRRPRTRKDACTPLAAVVGLSLTIPTTFLLQHFAVRAVNELPNATALRLCVSAIVTMVAFAVIPIAIVRGRNVRAETAFSLRRASWPAFLGAALLGASLWPLVYELIVAVHGLGLITIDESVKTHVRDLVLDLKEVSPVLTIGALAVVPAICEEVFFRGFLMSALRSKLSDRRAIFVTALIFGAFHVIIGPSLGLERLLPSFCMGLVLGYVCVRSGSLFPGIVLHATHNGILTSLIYFEDWLKEQNFDVPASAATSDAHIPLEWLAVGAVVAVVGAVLVHRGVRHATPAADADTATNPALHG